MTASSRMRFLQKVADYSMGQGKEQRKSQLEEGSWANKYKEEEFAKISTKDAIRNSFQATFILSTDTNT
jgi:hypothetical protein